MKTIFCLAVIAISGQEDQSKQVRELVDKLRSDQVEEREESFRKLGNLGPVILPHLKEALKGASDKEAQTRIETLIERFSPVSLDSIVARVRKAAASEEWTKKGWRDPELENLLARLVERIRSATGREGLRVPVRFDQVESRSNPKGLEEIEGGILQVTTGRQVGIIRRSILMADGDINAGQVESCVVLATGVVDIGIGRGNLVIAGDYIQVGQDLLSPAGDKEPQGDSILLSGFGIGVSIAQSTICCAPGFVTVSIADKVTYVIVPSGGVPREAGSRTVEIPRLELGMRTGKNALEGKLEITQAIPGGVGNGALLFRLPDGRGEYVARQGKQIRDPELRVVQGLEGWQVHYVSREFIAFGKDGQRASFWKKGERYEEVPGH